MSSTHIILSRPHLQHLITPNFPFNLLYVQYYYHHFFQYFLLSIPILFFFFFLNDTAPPEISPLPHHDPLPIKGEKPAQTPAPNAPTTAPHPPSPFPPPRH